MREERGGCEGVGGGGGGGGGVASGWLDLQVVQCSTSQTDAAVRHVVKRPVGHSNTYKFGDASLSNTACMISVSSYENECVLTRPLWDWL